MNLLVDERSASEYAFYIDGNLQFDTADEALYHESMALPALALARFRDAARVLICGGGDGLALRECLAFPGVEHVDLVDYSPEVVELGRTRFAEANGRAFEDARAEVHIADAWGFLKPRANYDVLLCDFTFPRTEEDSKVFSREWYEMLAAALAPGGVAAINAVSPQTTPEAFCCLVRTIRAAGLHALPYRVCIPSFRTHGYGAWGFVLAAHRPLHKADFRAIALGRPSRQADVTRLWRGAVFSRPERAAMATGPVNTLDDPCLLRMLSGTSVRSDRAASEPPSLDGLYESIPVSHPYHTRSMIETLAEQVVGTISKIDIKKLIDELLKRAAMLSARCVEELRILREYVVSRVFHPENWGIWSTRLFAALVIVLTISNSLAPDNAYAKGSALGGHSSVGRGYGFGFHGVGAPAASAPHAMSAPSVGTITGGGFRSRFGSSGPMDIYGTTYHVHSYHYYDYDYGYHRYGYGWGGYGYGYGYGYHPYSYGYGYYNHPRQRHVESKRTPVEHQPMFVADEDLMVLDNGDLLVTLSDDAYLAVSQGAVVLIHQKVPDPLLPLYADPKLFQTINEQIVDQRETAQVEIQARKDWLSWAGWTSFMFPVVQQDKQELSNLATLKDRLDKAVTRMGKASSVALAEGLIPSGSTQLFISCYLLPDGKVAFILPEGKLAITDGKTISVPGQKTEQVSPMLVEAVTSVMKKMAREMQADSGVSDKELSQLDSEHKQLLRDLAEYQNLQRQNPGDPYYEVDYGTDSVPVGQAISMTQKDIQDNENEAKQIQLEREKDSTEADKINKALQTFGK